MRPFLAALVVLVMGCAIAGGRMGEAPPPGSASPRSRRRAGGSSATRAVTAATRSPRSKLGPRLDILDDDAEDIAESIADPRDETVDGYPERLMPADYAQRMSDAELRALAVFVATASGGEAEEDDDSGRGRGRGDASAPRQHAQVTRRAARGGAAITRRSARAP